MHSLWTAERSKRGNAAGRAKGREECVHATEGEGGLAGDHWLVRKGLSPSAGSVERRSQRSSRDSERLRTIASSIPVARAVLRARSPIAALCKGALRPARAERLRPPLSPPPSHPRSLGPCRPLATARPRGGRTGHTRAWGLCDRSAARRRRPRKRPGATKRPTARQRSPHAPRSRGARGAPPRGHVRHRRTPERSLGQRR